MGRLRQVGKPAVGRVTQINTVSHPAAQRSPADPDLIRAARADHEVVLVHHEATKKLEAREAFS